MKTNDKVQNTNSDLIGDVMVSVLTSSAVHVHVRRSWV